MIPLKKVAVIKVKETKSSTSRKVITPALGKGGNNNRNPTRVGNVEAIKGPKGTWGGHVNKLGVNWF